MRARNLGLLLLATFLLWAILSAYTILAPSFAADPDVGTTGDPIEDDPNPVPDSRNGGDGDNSTLGDPIEDDPNPVPDRS